MNSFNEDPNVDPLYRLLKSYLSPPTANNPPQTQVALPNTQKKITKETIVSNAPTSDGNSALSNQFSRSSDPLSSAPSMFTSASFTSAATKRMDAPSSGSRSQLNSGFPDDLNMTQKKTSALHESESRGSLTSIPFIYLYN